MQNRHSGEQHSDSVLQCFTPKVSPESQIAKAQMFENTLKLEKLANFAKCKIEISRANLKSVASYKTEECTKGAIPVLDAMMETDAETLWTEASLEPSEANFNINAGSTPVKIPRWEQIFWLLVKESLACPCLAVLPHPNADTTARIRLHGAQQTHRKPVTGGELRVSSSMTEKTTVLGSTTVLGGTRGELRVSSSITEKTTDLGGTTVLGDTQDLTDVSELGLDLDVLQGADYTDDVRLALSDQSFVFGLLSLVCGREATRALFLV